MLNLLKNTKHVMAAALLMAGSVFAQDGNMGTTNKCRPQKSFEQGHELVQTQMMSGYNAPARIDVRGSWDVYADASFIYWQVLEDNLEIGVTSVGSPSTTNNNKAGQVVNVINPNHKYAPGFKLGFGVNFDHDNWDANAQYTWLHSSTRQASNGVQGGVLYAVNDWAPRQNSSNAYNSVVGNWRYKFDFVDLMMGRAYYVGNRLSLYPSFGARGAWMRQNFNTTYQGSGLNNAGTDKFVNTNRYYSWGVGPSASLKTNWMLGYGLDLVADLQADILFRQFNVHQSFQDTVASLNNTHFNQHHLYSLRPHTDFELGVEYGTYFDNNNWHVELSATYGFQVFWSENPFRKFTGASVSVPMNSFQPNGNLYMHGLTASARLDF